MKRLQNKIALVTGGGSGIGQAIARSFIEEGARVAITGRDLAKLEKTGKELGGKVLCVACDVAEPKQVAGLVERVHKELGPIDILVNNAGTNLKERTFRQLTIENWQKLMRTNLDGAFYCIHAVFPGMLERKDGVIININSIAGKRASPLGGVAYAASKFGMTGLGMSLGAEEKDSGIRICNIYPGEVDTPILEFRPQALSAEHRQKILRPEDVAAAALFVATLPAHVSVPELVIKPASATFI
jgi:NADP-dependent 3-hydroxy acid dehydrogenase YdfG